MRVRRDSCEACMRTSMSAIEARLSAKWAPPLSIVRIKPWLRQLIAEAEEQDRDSRRRLEGIVARGGNGA